MHPVVWLALAICSEVVATTALKLSDGFTRLGWGAVVVVGYGISFYALAVSLRSIEVLGAEKLAGIGLIIAGVVLLNVGPPGGVAIR